MPTVVLDAGHGGTNPGALNGTRREADDALRMALAVGNLLTQCGVRVIYTRSTNIDLPLARRAEISNNAGADLFVSIHRNASANPNFNGVENWVFTTPSQNALRAAQIVLDRVAAVGVQSNHGIKRGNFAVLRLTRAPAMLLELGFITNAEDNRLFDTNFNRYAQAVARGILDYFGIRCNVPLPPTTSTTGTVRTQGGNLNLRSAPNINAAVIGSIPNGTQLQITGQQNGFYNAIFNGVNGFASKDFIRL